MFPTTLNEIRERRRKGGRERRTFSVLIDKAKESLKIVVTTKRLDAREDCPQNETERIDVSFLVFFSRHLLGMGVWIETRAGGEDNFQALRRHPKRRTGGRNRHSFSVEDNRKSKARDLEPVDV